MMLLACETLAEIEKDASIGRDGGDSSGSPADGVDSGRDVTDAIPDVSADQDAASSIDATSATDADASSVPDASIGSCERWPDEELDSHACLHAERGPYDDVQATPTAAGASDVNRVHTAYRVGWPAMPHGFVRFLAEQTARRAIYTQGIASVTVIELPGGVVREPRVRGDSSCRDLPAVALYDMRQGTTYALSLAGDDAVPAMLVIETTTLDVVDGDGGVPVGGSCASDAVCCSRLCVHDTCVSAPPPRSCDGGAPAGALCERDGDCCTGSCADGTCGAPVCRSSGPCTSDEECCLFCHDGDHCH